MKHKVRLGLVAIALSAGLPVQADDSDVCMALEPMFERAAEAFGKWNDAGHSDRMSVMNLNSKVILAYAFASDNQWPSSVIASLDAMRIVALDGADPKLSREEIPAFILTQALTVRAVAVEKCVDSEFAELPTLSQ